MPAGNFGDYQISVYMRGMMGSKPARPFAIEELERLARERIDRKAYWYVAGGAGAGDTVFANSEAFQRWRIVPRMLTDVRARDHRVSLFNATFETPLMLAPIGVQEIVHPEAELAVARAAKATGTPLVLSTLSSNTLEAVAAALGSTPRWFQLYWPGDAALARSLMERAANAGYGAIVVTLDTRLMGWREKDLEEAYLPFLEGKGIANYTSDPVFREGLEAVPEDDIRPAVAKWAQVFADSGQTWDDLRALRRQTSLPMLVKGIVHPDDARSAVAAGVNGIIVSNHGGRQVDGAVGALDALPGVVEAAGGEVEILFDSGIRHGADVVKALALGAKAVLLGRPYLWGLAVAGEEGVSEVIQRLRADYDLTMALGGFRTPSELHPGVLART